MIEHETLTLHDVTELLQKVRRSGDGYVALCPAHEDNRQSLSLTEGSDGKVLLHCHAGCDFASITKAIGVSEAALCGEPDAPAKRIVAEYPYVDEDGALLYQVVRFEPKDFRQRALKNGEWNWSITGVRRVIFRLPAVLKAAAAHERVFVVEGEKDVLSLEALGYVATCNAGGADEGRGSKWRREFGEYLAGADVVIIPDNDPPGRVHAEWVNQSIPDSRIVELPGLPPKGDVSDWLAAGHTKEEFEALVAPRSALPFITPAMLRSYLKTIAETTRPTGIPTLDEATGGGLAGGTVILLAGAAGSCKSALALQIAMDRARATGGYVYIYAPDQGGRQPLVRLASTSGDIVVNDLAFGAYEAEAEKLLRVVDETASGISIEKFGAMLLELKDVAAVLIDTPQAVACDSEDEERLRINVTMDTAKRIADSLVVPVFVPSHANRSATAARKREDRTKELSAGLGSAALEHRAQVCLFCEKLPLEKPSPTTIRVVVTKSTARSGETFGLILDPATWRLREEAADLEAVDTGETAAGLTRRNELDEEIMGFLQRRWLRGEYPNGRGVRSGFRAEQQLAKKIGTRDQDVIQALARLEASARVIVNPGPKRSDLYYPPKNPGENE
jgi:archaellum biogenesis ATPase FlaH